MPEAAEEIADVLEDFDTEAAVSNIADDLFGQGDSDDGSEGSGTEGQGDKEPTLETPDPQLTSSEEIAPPAETPSAENSVEVQALGAPGTWSKEGLAEWAKIPPAAQAEILKREQDMFKGIEQYKDRAELGGKYDAVVEPFRPLLAASGIDPVGLFQSFASNHYMLSQGTPEQKVQVAANLMKGYGIDIAQVQQLLGNYTPPSPEVQAMDQRYQDLERRLAARDEADKAARATTISTEIEAFAANPANIYFNEVISDMIPLFSGGVASTLQQAYEMAVHNNPATRQKELDRLIADRLASAETERLAKVEQARKATGANVKASGKTRDGTVPVGSMDETLEATFAEIQSRG